jgi:hypothetical protein
LISWGTDQEKAEIVAGNKLKGFQFEALVYGAKNDGLIFRGYL